MSINDYVEKALQGQEQAEDKQRQAQVVEKQGDQAGQTPQNGCRLRSRSRQNAYAIRDEDGGQQDP